MISAGIFGPGKVVDGADEVEDRAGEEADETATGVLEPTTVYPRPLVLVTRLRSRPRPWNQVFVERQWCPQMTPQALSSALLCVQGAHAATHY